MMSVRMCVFMNLFEVLAPVVRAVIHLSRQKSFRFVYSANSKKEGSQLCHTHHLKHVLLGLTVTMPCTH